MLLCLLLIIMLCWISIYGQPSFCYYCCQISSVICVCIVHSLASWSIWLRMFWCYYFFFFSELAWHQGTISHPVLLLLFSFSNLEVLSSCHICRILTCFRILESRKFPYLVWATDWWQISRHVEFSVELCPDLLIKWNMETFPLVNGPF